MSEPVNVFQNKKTDKNRKLFVSLITSFCMAEAYETRTTAIASTRTMASCLLSKWCVNDYW